MRGPTLPRNACQASHGAAVLFEAAKEAAIPIPRPGHLEKSMRPPARRQLRATAGHLRGAIPNRPSRSPRLTAAGSTRTLLGPAMREVPLSAMAWQPLAGPQRDADPTEMLSSANSQYVRFVCPASRVSISSRRPPAMANQTRAASAKLAVRRHAALRRCDNHKARITQRRCSLASSAARAIYLEPGCRASPRALDGPLFAGAVRGAPGARS